MPAIEDKRVTCHECGVYANSNEQLEIHKSMRHPTLTNFINKKGKRYDYKLHYEELPSAPKVKRKPKTTEKNTKSSILDGNIILGFIHLVPFVFQRKSFNEPAVLSNIDDRKTMPKVPQAKKASHKGKN